MESESFNLQGHIKSSSHKRERNEGSMDLNDNENECDREEKKKKNNVESVNGRKRLLFHITASSFMEKLGWAVTTVVLSHY